VAVKLIAMRHQMTFLGEGYVPPQEFEVIANLAEIRRQIQTQADRNLAEKVDQIKAEYEQKLIENLTSEKDRLNAELEAIKLNYEQSANLLIETFKENLQVSLGKFWREEERPQLIEKVLRYLHELKLIDANSKVVMSDHGFKEILEALETSGGVDTHFLREKMIAVDYLPDHLLFVDQQSDSIFIDIEKVVEQLSLVPTTPS
jgi:predicted flavoprotein YhiN